MEESPKKMRFSQIATDQVPIFSCKPNRPSSPTNSSDHQPIMTSSQQNSVQHIHHHHHHHHEDLQIMMREQKDQCCGRDRLKRHHEEVAGRVMVPDRWGKEELMNDWIDYSSFDKVLVPNGIRSAREALVKEARRRQAVLVPLKYG